MPELDPLALDALGHFVQRIAIDLISEARLSWSINVAIFCDADAVLDVRTVADTLGLGHLEPDVVGHRKLTVEVNRVVQCFAPVVRRALHAEQFREAGYFHPARDPTDVVDYEPHNIDGSPADILPVVVRGRNELANVERHL